MKQPDPSPGKASGWLPGLIFTGALAAVSVWIAQAWLTPPPPAPILPLPQSIHGITSAPQPLAHNIATATLSPEKAALLDHPAIRHYANQLATQQSLQHFFAAADDMTLEQRQHQATRIREDLRQASQQGEVSAGEQLLVELALLPLTLEDAQEREEARITLQQHYQNQYDQAVTRWQQQSGPQLDAYREQQQKIIAEAMAREDFADARDRDRYLQQQLQQARESIYRQNPD